MEKKRRNIFFSRKAGFISVLIVAFTLIAGIGINVYIQNEKIDMNPFDDPVYEETWHLVQRVDSWALGEATPSGGEGWLSAFILDYGEVPETVLANNATDWSASGDARGYVDTDNTETDLASEDPGYFVMRCVFDDDAKNGSDWEYDRFRVNLTVSGDETISGVGEYDNSTTDGDAVVSGFNSTNDHIYVNFWWDDNVDGYRITDDGTLTWSISIYERY